MKINSIINIVIVLSLKRQLNKDIISDKHV